MFGLVLDASYFFNVKSPVCLRGKEMTNPIQCPQAKRDWAEERSDW